MGPLLFSLALCQLIDNITDGVLYNFWYFDDGSLIGNRSQITKFYNLIKLEGPSLGTLGEKSFPTFSPDLTRHTDVPFGALMIISPH